MASQCHQPRELFAPRQPPSPWTQQPSARRRAPAAAAAEASPPRTPLEAASQARSALRRWRDAAAGAAGPAQRRLRVDLPLPRPGAGVGDPIEADDESDWPGGCEQRHRAVRPLVEAFLDGYRPEFVGMLESPADGIGAWRVAGGPSASPASPGGGPGPITVVSGVTNATFQPFARLCAGEYGEAVLRPDHLLVCLNCVWSSSKDIGQFWERGLRSQAAALIDSAEEWEVLYRFETDLRTAAGATGVAFRSWPGPFCLYLTPKDEGDSFGGELTMAAGCIWFCIPP